MKTPVKNSLFREGEIIQFFRKKCMMGGPYFVKDYPGKGDIEKNVM